MVKQLRGRPLKEGTLGKEIAKVIRNSNQNSAKINEIVRALDRNGIR